MSTKPENTFIASVHRKFGISKPYFEKTNNPWRSGTPDVYYSGLLGSMWIEFKFLPRIPRSKEILLDLTPRQRFWLNNRFAEGRNVAVVLGTPDGGVILKSGEWNRSFTSVELSSLVQDRGSIAAWIMSQVGAEQCDLSVLSKQPLK